MRCLITRLPVIALAVLFAAGALLGPNPAEAQGESRAGLVVAHGDGRMAYALVTFDGESISGEELLDRSGLPVTEVSFGGLGVAVCAIEETGCDIGECRKRVCQGPQRDDPYWQYFTSNGDGSWHVAALGISGDQVENGQVRALIWSAGEPEFPSPSLDQLAAKAGSVNGEGVALTRYQANGETDDGVSDDDDGVPYPGIIVVLIAVVIVGGVFVRRRSGRRR
jgi:hypothetical protein